ncbi:MAG TPA: hypothetical protein VD788_05615 [Candidatus Polarisedimenticolaceae bacterium]|nr:hypothetical protein [Candidatus Polarisedimenticolaceae bacterium]
MSSDLVERLPIVGVMGSGRAPHLDRAEPLGRWLAGAGVHLLTGGGGGVMTAVSRAFHRVVPRAGRVIAILPGSVDGTGYTTRAGYPNPWVEIPIATHLPLSGARGTETMSRNHINVLTADLIVALPGGAGTSSEVALAVAYGRPVVVFAGDRRAIPGLAGDVPLEPRFEGVEAFVRRVLDRES